MELGLGDEHVLPNEAAVIQEIVDVNFKTFKVGEKPLRRAQHPKSHGCVRARFEVRNDIPTEFQHGLFATPATYDALIRFSSAQAEDDKGGDAHGMAVKLWNVPGPKLLPGHEDSTEHDFLLLDREVFFVGNMPDYLTANKHFSNFSNWQKNKRGFLRLVTSGLTLVIGHFSLLKTTLKFASRKPSSPLGTNYWSTTPYRLGGTAVKYMVTTMQPLPDGQIATKNGLGDALRSYLAKGAAQFEFGIHVQSDPVKHPVEDSTVNWSENGAAYVPIAMITIDQTTDVQSDEAENLRFQPWHALAEHRPLGGVNRTRKAVYLALAKHRNRVNGVVRGLCRLEHLPTN
jgi:hypothetical protein